MSVKHTEITKENLPNILKDLGKEYKKKSGKHMPAEIVMVGGAAILAKYGFRNLSYDLDAIIRASSAMKDAANAVRDKYNLEHHWLNSDFQNTDSYSKKLYEHSHHYRTFSNVLNIRIVNPEYLLATKLKSARPYKHDLSDIVGIITEERATNPNFTKELIMKAYYDMYGDDATLDKNAEKCMNQAFTTTTPKKLISDIRESEKEANSLLHKFEDNYPGVLKEQNINGILISLKTKEKELSDDELILALEEKARQQERTKHKESHTASYKEFCKNIKSAGTKQHSNKDHPNTGLGLGE